MKRLFVTAILMLVVTIPGCVSDYNDPYEDYESPDLNWPTLDPNRYHWDGFANPYYEKWHYKVTDPETKDSFMFVYGVQNPGAIAGEPSSAFVYATRDDGDGIFLSYPTDKFAASVGRCDVQVGSSHAFETVIDGKLADGEDTIVWNLRIEILSEWTETMGMLKNIPALPVNWYVNALNAHATGKITWKGTEYELEEAPSYNDHSWGSVYPSAWLWVQANGFNREEDALAVAGGPVALGPIEPPGFMIVYKAGNDLYEFRSQDLNVVFEIDEDPQAGRLELTAIKGSQKIVIFAAANPEDAIDVQIPTQDGMVIGAVHYLAADLVVDIYEQEDWEWQLVNRATSKIGSLGFGGEYAGYNF